MQKTSAGNNNNAMDKDYIVFLTGPKDWTNSNKTLLVSVLWKTTAKEVVLYSANFVI